jgi:spermidine synthase
VSRSRVPGRWYAALELSVGIWSLLLIYMVPPANRLFSTLMGMSPTPLRHWAIAFIAPFLILLPATGAMGATLPAVEHLFSRLRRDGWSVGGVYAANTLGAMLGAVFTTFVISPAFGFRKTLLGLAAANILCAAGVLLSAARKEVARPPVEDAAPGLPPARRLLVILFWTGLFGIGYEVLVLRVLSQVLENTVYSFAGALAVYLLGTALGAALYQTRARRESFEPVLIHLLQATATCCLLGLLILWAAAPIISTLGKLVGHGIAGSISAEIGLSLAVFLLPTVAMGALFSHLAQAVKGRNGGLGRALAVNTLGASLAPLLFGVVLLPRLGSPWALVLASLGYLLFWPTGRRSYWMPALVPAGLAIILLLNPSHLKMVDLPAAGRVAANLEGVMATVTVVEDKAGENYLKVNNKFQMGSTASSFSDLRQGHIPLLLHPHPRKALFLGLGTGTTFAASADYPDLDADGVELIPEILSVLPYFKKSTGDLTRNPRLHTVAADARRYVQACPKNYDVIIGDLFHPARDGAGYLYTVEHFQAVKKRLAPGGIFCQWLPMYQLDMPVFKTIVRTFLEVFPDASAYLAHFSLANPIIGLVGGGPLRSAEPNWFDRRVGEGVLRERLKALQLRNVYEFLGCYLAGAEQLSQLAGAGPLNTDDHPMVMFEAPRFVYMEQEPASNRLIALIDSLSPHPADVLPVAEGREKREARDRLAAYWTARNRFLHAGVGVPRTGDVRELLSYVREPLLEVVRMSPDFDPAYRPLLAMAEHLVRIDPDAGRNLVVQLIDANPARSEALRILGSLTPPLKPSSNP